MSETVERGKHFCDVHHCMLDATHFMDTPIPTYLCDKHYAMGTSQVPTTAHEDVREPIKFTPTHPLLNPDSRHYEMIGGQEAIQEMEKLFTVEELMAWAKITAMKYRLRIGKKDDPLKEIAKIKSFEAYYSFLEDEDEGH